MYLKDNSPNMSRTDISAFLDYNPPIVSTQCGEIYCSQDLDYFLINCSTCTQEYNLLSISLFIKHIQECIPTNLKKSCEVEEEIINLSSDEDEEEHIVQNFIEDNPEDEEIATLPSEGIITQCETQSLNSLDDYKLTVEEEQIVQQSCDYNIQNEVQSLTNSGDDLLALKQEFINKNNGTTIDLADETIDISDYQEEDDIVLNKLPRQTLLEMIINEYRKHPVLWDITLRKKTSRRVRNHHLKQIWKAINSNLNANLTILDLQKHISRLRYGFERVLKKKEKFEKRHPDGSVKFHPQLWYFEKMSFIKGTSKDCGIEQVSTNMSYASELSDEELLDEEYSGSSKKQNTKTLQKQETLDMIREYKKHQVLWNKEEPLHYDRDSRNYAFGQITNFINNKYNKNLTIEKMRVRIANIRNKYSRVKKNKQMKNAPINLWYYNELSFIEGQYDNLEQTIQNTSGFVGDYINLDNDDSVDDKTTVANMLVKQQLGVRTKDKNILLAMIEEYRKQPRLWNTRIYSTSNTIRRTIYEGMAETINAKFNTNFTHSDFSREIHQMRYVYKRMLRRRERSTHRRLESSLWYADAISFIDEGIPQEESKNLIIDGDSSCDVVDSKRQKERIYLRNKSPLRRAIRNKNDILNIIELYKSAPILWNTYHPDFHTWAERRKVVEEIVVTLGEKYECFMTVDQFYNEIKLLRQRYVSALRRIINAKQQHRNTKMLPRPFYFNQISFLEPFVAPAGAGSAPDLEVSDKIYKSEDFIFLTENKPLLKAFIELYETQHCLWDPMDKNKNNPFVQSASYEKLIQFFSDNNIKQTKEQVLSAIAFLHSTVVDTQKTFEFGDPNTTNKPPVWFYEHLRFLGNISGVKNKYCNHCGKYFRSITAYEKHRIEIAADSPYKCALCNEGFKSLDLYTCHKKTHNEPKKCDQCDFRSYNKHNLSVHMRSHISSSQFPCEQCENGFFTSTELIRHIQKHTGKKIGAKDSYSSDKRQICNICGESITRKERLVQHRLKHKCKSCGKLFPPTSGLSLNSNSLIPRHQCDDAELALE